MRVALYPRVSTQEQAKEGYSIGEQIERLTDYCKAMRWEVYKIYTDPGYSGGNTDRPGLQEMIKDVEAGLIDKVVVYKLDRLSRSQLDTLYLIEKVFLANGTDFVSMSENFDTSTPFGRAMIGILAVFAQLEREQIKERMGMGKEDALDAGKLCPAGRQRHLGGLAAVDEHRPPLMADVGTGQKPVLKRLHAAGARQYDIHLRSLLFCLFSTLPYFAGGGYSPHPFLP